MLSVTRTEARRGRTIIRKCLAGKPRGPAPPVWIVPSSRGLALIVAIDEVTIRLPIACNAYLDQPFMLPLDALDAVEGAGDDPVQVVPDATQINMHWKERGLPRTQSFALVETREALPRLAMPKSLTSVSPRFLHALHEAGRSTTRAPQRYALHRVQVRGAAGEVIGTDAHFVIRFEGFTLPFEDEILVPAVSFFGLDAFSKAEEIRIGRTRQCLIVVTGDVTVWLRVDRDGRYPDVARVFPKNAPAASVTLI